MKRLSIQWKLTLWYGGVLAAVTAAFGASVYATLRHQLLGRIDQGLKEELADVLSEVRRADDPNTLRSWLDRRFGRHEGFDFQIARPDGTRFFVNRRLGDRQIPQPDGDAALGRPSFRDVPLTTEVRWRVVAVRVDGPDGPLTVQVARPLAAFDHELDEVLATLLVVWPLTLAVTVVGGYFLARKALAPVDRITRAADSITAAELSRRVEVPNPHDELGALARTLNRMVERLERSFAEMRQFTADAAHELRTPLAVIRNEAEVALRSPRAPDEYRKALENVLDEATRLGAVADQLLFLCRQDTGLLPPALEEVDVGGVVREVTENMRLVAEEKGVSLVTGPVAQCTLVSDGRLIRRVLYNLLDNAIKFTPRCGQVTATAEIASGWWAVAISDTGAGIPAEHLGRVFERFYRADPARADEHPGAGLGLAICQSIARALSGAVSIESTVGTGTTVRFALPMPSPLEVSQGSAGTRT